MSLFLKYFVLKPKAKKKEDPHAAASQAALYAYADAIRDYDINLARQLEEWANVEAHKQKQLKG